MIMERLSKFKIWLNALQYMMQFNGVIKPETKLYEKGWKPYFDEGMTIGKTLTSEFGNDWKRESVFDTEISYWDKLKRE